MFLLLCWAVCMSFVNKWRFLPAPAFSQNHCLVCRVIFLNKILENWKQLATLCKKLNLSGSEIQFRLRHISRWWKTFRSLFKALSSFPSSSSFGSTKQHFQYLEVKYTLWRCCMQGKAIDISLELRSVPAPRQDKRGVYRNFQNCYWDSWHQCIPQSPSIVVLVTWPDSA